MAVLTDESPPVGLLSLDLTSAVALSPKNFTSLKRTPWAGSSLARGIKKNQAETPEQRIGESWELSCDPELPSRLTKVPEATLADLIACRTSECLSGSLVATGRTSCDILVKLINAASPLSLQIHPADDNKFLKPSEGGKPESWLVLAAEPGAGIYLGFSKDLSVGEIRDLIESGGFNQDLLQFVPVKPGDYFEIEPHVPHAIGPGTVLLEPQRVVAGKLGKTWRLWDWNRKYNAHGVEDAVNGQPRELHLVEGCSILDPKNQFGTGYSERLKRVPSSISPAPGVTAKVYPPNTWYQTILIEMQPESSIKLIDKACFAGCFVFEGLVYSASQFTRRATTMLMGESYFIPSVALPHVMSTKTEPAKFALVLPSGKGVPAHGGSIFR